MYRTFECDFFRDAGLMDMLTPMAVTTLKQITTRVGSFFLGSFVIVGSSGELRYWFSWLSAWVVG